MRRIASAAIPVAGATASGVNGCASASTSATPSARPSGRTRSSAKSTWTSAKSSSASVPGRIGWCSSASSAVRERRGSTTTSLPPRARSARSRPRMSGAVSSEPLEASGLAPSISRCIVRSTSGIGTVSAGAEHQRGGDLLGPLVDRARRVDALAAQRLEQHAAVEQRGEPVRGRVADVDGDRVAAVGLEQRREPLGDHAQRLVPARGPQLAVGAAHAAACAAGPGPRGGPAAPRPSGTGSRGRRRRRRRRGPSRPRSPRTVTSRPHVASQNGQVRNAVRSSMAKEPTGPGGSAGREAPLNLRRDLARPRSAARDHAPWHFLYFLPDPHQHGSLRPICSCSSRRRCSTAVPPAACGSSASTP